MSKEQPEDNDLDAAYRRFGKRLKEKIVDPKPPDDPELRRRIQRIDAKTPHKAKLFAEVKGTLEQLKDEFQIAFEPPKALPELLTYLLAQQQMDTPTEPSIAASDLYTRIHEIPGFPGVSSKKYRQVLTKLAKQQVLQLQESQGTLIIYFHQEFMSEDEAELLNIAARKGGTFSLEQAMLSTKWSQARVRMALDALLRKKIIVRKTGFVQGTRYQAPGQD